MTRFTIRVEMNIWIIVYMQLSALRKMMENASTTVMFSPMSRGANRLCSTNLVSTVYSMEDLERKMRRHFGLPTCCPYDEPKGPEREHDDILAALTASPMRADELARALHMQPLDVLKALASYEMDGKVERLPDGRYSPSAHRLVSTR